MTLAFWVKQLEPHFSNASQQMFTFWFELALFATELAHTTLFNAMTLFNTRLVDDAQATAENIKHNKQSKLKAFFLGQVEKPLEISMVQAGRSIPIVPSNVPICFFAHVTLSPHQIQQNPQEPLLCTM